MGGSLWDTLPAELQCRVLFQSRCLELARQLEAMPKPIMAPCGHNCCGSSVSVVVPESKTAIHIRKGPDSHSVTVDSSRTGWFLKWFHWEMNQQGEWTWCARHRDHGQRISGEDDLPD